jgi:hypothetical protein
MGWNSSRSGRSGTISRSQASSELPAVVSFQNLLAEYETRLRLVELCFDPRHELEES